MPRVLLPLCLLCALAAPLQARPVTVCAVQARLRLYDSPAQFRAHMGHLTALAMRHDPDLIVFPEDVGTPLVALGDRDLLRDCASLPQAVTALVARHGPQIAPIQRRWGVGATRALFLLKSPQIERTYADTFTTLARRHHVLIAAGSLLVSAAPETGRIVNRMTLFGPHGSLGYVDKVHPIPLELAEGLDITPAAPASLRPVPSPLGRLGLLICADAWYPDLADNLRRDGACLLVNALANLEPWGPETEAGLDNSLPARVAQTGLPGVQAFAVTGPGRGFLGLQFAGRSKLLEPVPAAGGGEEGERRAASGFRVVACARSHDREEIVCARIELP